MEFSEVLRRRRMVRRFRPDPVADDVLGRVLAAARRGPSAGFSQGTEVLLLRCEADRAAFWDAATPESAPTDGAWRQGLRGAPVLLVFWSDPDRYRSRYAEPDKAATAARVGRPGPDLQSWPVPWWDVDTGMAALLVLLAATDEGLGACLFGVPAGHADAVRAQVGAPSGLRPVGVVALGHPDAGPRAPARSRRPAEEQVHEGRFGVPWRGDARDPVVHPSSGQVPGVRSRP